MNSLAIEKIATRALLFQCGLFLLAIATFAAKLGGIPAWLLGASLVSGITSFFCAFALVVATRRLQWLGLAAITALISLFSLLTGVVSGGHPGI